MWCVLEQVFFNNITLTVPRSLHIPMGTMELSAGGNPVMDKHPILRGTD